MQLLYKQQITKTTLYILPHPHAHTSAQTQNKQSPPPQTDPPTMQVDENQLQVASVRAQYVRMPNTYDSYVLG